MTDDPCPNCGSEDYGPVNEGHERCCLACGYDTENGTQGVCPGGKHPLDGNRSRLAPSRTLCCDACYKRLPRDLPEWPKFRSRLRSNYSQRMGISPDYFAGRRENEAICEAIRTWLSEHPRETSNP